MISAFSFDHFLIIEALNVDGNLVLLFSSSAPPLIVLISFRLLAAEPSPPISFCYSVAIAGISGIPLFFFFSFSHRLLFPVPAHNLLIAPPCRDFRLFLIVLSPLCLLLLNTCFP